MKNREAATGRGLLARASYLREQSEKPQIVKKPRKLGKFMLAAGAAAFLTAFAAGTMFDSKTAVSEAHKGTAKTARHVADSGVSWSVEAEPAASAISQGERDMLAKLLYGEAGRGADPFEVAHTVVNRASVWGESLTDVMTRRNQFIGYKSTHPVEERYRGIADMVLDDWERSGFEPVDGCGRFFFTSGKHSLPYNQFAVSEDGTWHNRVITREGTFCDHAMAQAAEFNARETASLTLGGK